VGVRPDNAGGSQDCQTRSGCRTQARWRSAPSLRRFTSLRSWNECGSPESRSLVRPAGETTPGAYRRPRAWLCAPLQGSRAQQRMARCAVSDSDVHSLGHAAKVMPRAQAGAPCHDHFGMLRAMLVLGSSAWFDKPTPLWHLEIAPKAHAPVREVKRLRSRPTLGCTPAHQGHAWWCCAMLRLGVTGGGRAAQRRPDRVHLRFLRTAHQHQPALKRGRRCPWASPTRASAGLQPGVADCCGRPASRRARARRH
jgi:hypothetical protein